MVQDISLILSPLLAGLFLKATLITTYLPPSSLPNPTILPVPFLWDITQGSPSMTQSQSLIDYSQP